MTLFASQSKNTLARFKKLVGKYIHCTIPSMEHRHGLHSPGAYSNDDPASAIHHALLPVEVAQEHNRGANSQPKLVGRHATGQQGVEDLDGVDILLFNGIGAEEVCAAVHPLLAGLHVQNAGIQGVDVLVEGGQDAGLRCSNDVAQVWKTMLNQGKGKSIHSIMRQWEHY